MNIVKMKIAVCYSGSIRNFLAKTAPEHIFYHSLNEDMIIINKTPISYYMLKRAKGEEYH
jgi:hypothetical protein